MFSYLQEKFKEAVVSVYMSTPGSGSQFIQSDTVMCFRDMESERERLAVLRRQMRDQSAHDETTQRPARTGTTQHTVRAPNTTHGNTRRNNR